MATAHERIQSSKTLVCLLQGLVGVVTSLELRNEIVVEGTIAHVDHCMKSVDTPTNLMSKRVVAILLAVPYRNDVCVLLASICPNFSMLHASDTRLDMCSLCANVCCTCAEQLIAHIVQISLSYTHLVHIAEPACVQL